MALSTYSDLKTSIGNWLNRSDLTSYLDDFIDIAEERMMQDLRVREMEDRQEATMSTSSRYLAVPTGFIEMRRLHISSTTPIHRLFMVSPEQTGDFYDSASGKPNYYAVVGSEIEFNRVPDSAYTVEMAFYKTLTALSDANTTNDILTNYPGVYLYGSLVAASEFLMLDSTYWATLYMAHVKKANDTDKRGRFSGSSIQMRSDVYPV